MVVVMILAILMVMEISEHARAKKGRLIIFNLVPKKKKTAMKTLAVVRK